MCVSRYIQACEDKYVMHHQRASFLDYYLVCKQKVSKLTISQKQGAFIELTCLVEVTWTGLGSPADPSWASSFGWLAGDQLIRALIFFLETPGQAGHIPLMVGARVERSKQRHARSLEAGLSHALPLWPRSTAHSRLHNESQSQRTHIYSSYGSWVEKKNTLNQNSTHHTHADTVKWSQ